MLVVDYCMSHKLHFVSLHERSISSKGCRRISVCADGFNPIHVNKGNKKVSRFHISKGKKVNRRIYTVFNVFNDLSLVSSVPRKNICMLSSVYSTQGQ